MRLFGLLMAMIMGVSFTACEADEDAIISIVVDGEVNLEPLVGEQINISYNVVSDNKLDLVEHIINNVPVASVEDFSSSNSYAGTFTIPTNTVGQVIASIRVTDRKGLVEMRTFTINVQSNIETYTAVLLGNQSTTAEGSFYASSTNRVYKYAESGANAATIDFVYVLDGTKHAIAAPNDPIFTTILTNVSSWTTRNATKLKITLLSKEDFNAISNDAEITEQTNVVLSIVTELAVDDVVAFTTAQGKKGLFMIETIANNTMTIKVKVQE